jgi:dipeptidase E
MKLPLTSAGIKNPTIGNPAYAIDDETAIKIVDGTVDVISEGSWQLFG